MPCFPALGVTNELAASNQSPLHRVNPTSKACSALGMWESTCSSQRGSDSAQWEVGGAVRKRALCPACSPSAHPPQTRPLWLPFLQRAEHSSPGGQPGAGDPPAHRKPSVCSIGVQLQAPPGSRIHTQGDYVISDVPLHPTALRKSPLGSSVASMKAGGRDWRRLKAPGQEEVSPSDSGGKGSGTVHTEGDL